MEELKGPEAFGFVGKRFLGDSSREATEQQTEYLQDMLDRAFEGSTVSAQKKLRNACSFSGMPVTRDWFYGIAGTSFQIEFLSTDGPHIEALRLAMMEPQE